MKNQHQTSDIQHRTSNLKPQTILVADGAGYYLINK